MGSSSSKQAKSSGKPGCLKFGKSNGSKKEIILATLGLDNAGKTSIVLALSKELEKTEEIMPTVGFDSKSITLFGQPAKMFDLGGGTRIRGIWKNYFAEVHGIVYVVDAADPSRVEESAKEFQALAKNTYIHGKPLLILANKSDKRDALSEYELTEMMNLEEIVNVNKIPTKVQASTTKTKDHKTIKDGMKWLFMSIAADWKDLSERVERDMSNIKEKRKAERQEKLERIRKQKEEREVEGGEPEEEQDEDADDIVDATNPFQAINDHLSSKAANNSNKEKKTKKNFEQTQFVDEEGRDMKATNKSLRSSGDGPHLKNDRLPQVVEEPDASTLTVNGDMAARRPERVPSPLPAPFGEGLTSLPSRLPPLGGGHLAPLSTSSPLKPLDFSSEETSKKKKKRKKKARILPTSEVHGLMPVEEEAD
ncbi:ADP-ribosylation factor-like protein 13B [Watersipora subatra]|uniref:ADP-ribosylation factor-like protein 13B n=1 Tax=Watersipora subatra TaxID=2589382 RepID=UPI00355B0E2E